jgi:hypothetical protein
MFFLNKTSCWQMCTPNSTYMLIDTELQLSGKKSLKIPNGQSESIFGVAYSVICRALQIKIS